MKLHIAGIIAITALIALGMQACSPKLKPQESCNFVQNPEQQRVSWKSQIPVRLFVHKSVPTAAYGSIDRAVEEYNTALGNGREILKVVARGAEGALDPRKDGASMVYWFTDWDANRPTEQARTTIYWAGTQIFEADVRINAKNFDLNLDPTTSFSNLDLESLLVHEFGHALGLAHISGGGSVMNFSLNEGQDRRTLGVVDLSSLHCEY